MIRSLPVTFFSTLLQAFGAPTGLQVQEDPDEVLREADLMQLGQEALRHGDTSSATEYFSAATSTMPRAQLGLQALHGKFNSWQVESLAEQFIQLAMDPAALGAMVMAANTFQMARGLSHLQLGRIGMGRLATPISFSLAFAAEAATFPLHHRLLDGVLGRPMSFEQHALRQDLRASFLTLGALRLFGSGATWVYRRVGAIARWHELFQQGGMALGILSSRGLETALGWHGETFDSRSWWLQSAVTWLHFNVAGRVLHIGRASMSPWGASMPARPFLRFPREVQWAQASATSNRNPMAAVRNSGAAEGLHYFSLGRPHEFFELNRTEQFEAMSRALDRSGGEVRAAAETLGISEKTFRNRLQQAKVERPEALLAWLEYFSPQAQQRRQEDLWNQMAEALDASGGQLKGAAQQLGISESTFHYRLSQARELAPNSNPIRRWVQRLAPERQRQDRAKQFREIARALETSGGNILAASRLLGVSPTLIYRALQRVEAGNFPHSPLGIWVERFTQQGKRRARRRRWMEYTRALIHAGGNIKQTSKNLNITQGTYGRFLEEITTLDGTDSIDPYYRRIILCALSRARPTDRRLLQLLREGNHETFRLSVLQSLTSEARVVQSTLRHLLEIESAPLLRIVTEYSLYRSRGDRVLWLLGMAGRRLNFQQILRGTGMLSRQLTALLQGFQTGGKIEVNDLAQYSLSPEGMTAFRALRHPLRWDLLNEALNQSQGNRRQAASLLGVSHETLNKQLQSSLGRNGDPAAVAPIEHPLHRWGDELFLARIRRRQLRASRIERYQARWECISRTLAEQDGDFTKTATALGITENRLASLIRLAVAYDWEPLRPYGEPELWRAHRAKKLELQWRDLRQQNRQWYLAHSAFRDLSIHELPLSNPIKNTSQALRVELVLRYQMGQRRAGDLLIRIYEPWIRSLSRGKRRPGISLRDLDQAGREGLLEAVERFDPARGNQLSTYAYWYILKNQVDLLRSHLAMEVSPRDYQLFQQVQELRWEAQKRGESMSDGDLMRALNLDAARLQEVLQVGASAYAQSLDQSRGDTGGTTLQERTVGSTADGYRGRLSLQFRQSLHAFFSSPSQMRNALWSPEMLMMDREEIVDLAQRNGVTPKQYLKSRQKMLAALQVFLASRGIHSGFFD